MAAIRVVAEFDLAGFSEHVNRNLPGYQRPLFLRLLRDQMRVTATFKHQKVQYREEGYDLRKVEDPLFVLVDGAYTELTEALATRIEAGELTPS
jgi:hypothetical protein